MINLKFKDNSIFIITLVFLFFGVALRSYNINFEYLWFDEILSFWIANPNIPLSENLERHKSIESIPFLYNFLLKQFYGIFGYEINVGRYLSLILNILSIILITLTSYNIKKNNAYILSLFLLSFNVFLIAYAQEMRSYSLVLFLCSLDLFFLIYIIKKDESKDINILIIIIFTLIQVLMILSHPFTLIIFFSTVIFSYLSLYKLKKKFRELNYSIFFTSIFTVFYLFIYLKNMEIFPSWIDHPDLSFYTNFYFSKFFGSRILGLVHLITLIGLFLFFIKEFKKKFYIMNIFIMIIFFSYFLPITYGYLFQPILFPRYIIFVIIPIIILLSFLIFEIKNFKFRNIILILFFIVTIGNQYTETNFQQFLKERPHHKPNFGSILLEINNSNEKSYTFDIPVAEDKKVPSYLALENYFSKLVEDKNFEIEYININKFIRSNKKKIWTICLQNIVNNNCVSANKDLNSNIIQEKEISGVLIKLINKK